MIQAEEGGRRGPTSPAPASPSAYAMPPLPPPPPQYAHARIASIMRKSGADPEALLAGGSRVALDHPKEVAL
jgi:hypothetical protein